MTDMLAETRLSTRSLGTLPTSVCVPGYDRQRVSVGWVHIGPGAFHRAHQAMYVDAFLAASDDPSWGICTVGVLPGDTAVRDALVDQDGLYALLTVDPAGTTEARVIGSVVRHLHAPDDPKAVLDVLADPRTRVVSLTITEGGYADDDPTPPDPDGGLVPSSAFDYLVAALAQRRAAGTPAFTVLSCDNIQGNGQVAQAAVTRHAARRDPELGAWIAEHVSFPSSMVDRITPVTTDATRVEAEQRGIDDRWPVRAESFAQWVVEDRFPAGRPGLECVGVQFVPDVMPYEKLKLRLLNASHQAMSYLGLLSGATYVHELCRDPLFVAFVRGYMDEEAIPTLDPVPGVDVDDYCDQLLARFASTAIEDTLARQVVDGSERVAKFLLPVVVEQLQRGGGIRHVAFVLAAWSRFLERENEFRPVDRRLPALREAVARERRTPGSFLTDPAVLGELGSDPRLRDCFLEGRDALHRLGASGAMVQFLEHSRRATLGPCGSPSSVTPASGSSTRGTWSSSTRGSSPTGKRWTARPRSS